MPEILLRLLGLICSFSVQFNCTLEQAAEVVSDIVTDLDGNVHLWKKETTDAC